MKLCMIQFCFHYVICLKVIRRKPFIEIGYYLYIYNNCDTRV